jgi:hypothetical protein
MDIKPQMGKATKDSFTLDSHVTSLLCNLHWRKFGYKLDGRWFVIHTLVWSALVVSARIVRTVRRVTQSEQTGRLISSRCSAQFLTTNRVTRVREFQLK